jgi:hypothetical protein
VTSDELLDRPVVAKIPEIAKDGHEPLASEWGTLNVYVLRSRRRSENMLVRNVVGEEVDDDIEQTRYEIMLTDNVHGNRWCGEKLKGEVFYGCFRFTVNQEISVSHAMIDAGKVRSCNTSRCAHSDKRIDVPMAILCGCESVNMDA